MTSVSQYVSQPYPKDMRKSKIRNENPHADVWIGISYVKIQHSVQHLWGLNILTYGEKYSYRRIGLELTNSFVRSWEILMCHISLKFQEKNILKSFENYARIVRGTEQRPKIEISRLKYPLKFSVTLWNSTCVKKGKPMGFTKMLFFSRRWTCKKIWRTAMADSGTDSEMIILSLKAASVEKTCVRKGDIILSWRYDWEMCMWKMKGVSRHYLLKRTLSEWCRVGQFSCSMEVEELPIFPDSKEICGFTKLPSILSRGLELRRFNLYNRYPQQH